MPQPGYSNCRWCGVRIHRFGIDGKREIYGWCDDHGWFTCTAKPDKIHEPEEEKDAERT